VFSPGQNKYEAKWSRRNFFKKGVKQLVQISISRIPIRLKDDFKSKDRPGPDKVDPALNRVVKWAKLTCIGQYKRVALFW
jgi:hypothetical protein